MTTIKKSHKATKVADFTWHKIVAILVMLAVSFTTMVPHVLAQHQPKWVEIRPGTYERAEYVKVDKYVRYTYVGTIKVVTRAQKCNTRSPYWCFDTFVHVFGKAPSCEGRDYSLSHTLRLKVFFNNGGWIDTGSKTYRFGYRTEDRTKLLTASFSGYGNLSGIKKYSFWVEDETCYWNGRLPW